MWRALSLAVVWMLSTTAAYAADPTPAAAPAVRAIFFASGSSRGTVGGHVMRGQYDLYSLAGEAGQTMSLTLTAPDDNAVFQIYRPGTTIGRSAEGVIEFKGQPLRTAGDGEVITRWSGRLPDRGTYLLAIGSTRGQARYSMDIRLD